MSLFSINSLKKKSFHFLLIPLVFVLHTWNHYFGLIPLFYYGKFILLYVSLAIALFFLSKIIFRTNLKTSIYTTWLLLLFFGFGAFHDFIKNISFPHFFVSYTFLLPFILLLCIASAVLIKRKKKRFHRLNYFFNLLFVVLLCFECLQLLYNSLWHKQSVNDLADSNKKLSNKYNPCENCQKPDIYFIVWDGYTSSECLKNTFGYDNSDLDSFLINDHFFISRYSRSNYRITPMSVASTLNMNYLDDRGMVGKIISAKMMSQAENTVKKNELVTILEKEGYEIKNYSVFDFDDHPTASSKFFSFYPDRFLFAETLAGRIKRDIWWNFVQWFTGNSKEQLPVSVGKRKTIVNDFINNSLEKLLGTIDQKKDKPIFVYTHIMLPHEPFFLDEKGNFVSDSLLIKQHNSKEGYVRQVKYTNSLIKKIVSEMMADSTRQKIIVIEGDHGFRNYLTDAEQEKSFMNLNTYYFPDYDYSKLYKTISPVNTFRVVLDKFFDKKLPLLKDSSVNMMETSTGY